MYVFPKLSLGKKPICSAPSGHSKHKVEDVIVAQKKLSITKK